MKHSKKWAGWFAAGAVTIFLAAVLITGNPNQAQADQTLQKHEGLFRQLFPYAGEGAESFERLSIESSDELEMAYTVLRGGETLGYTAKKTVQGYGGPIELIIGIRTDGTLAGLHIGGADFKETEGLGAKAKEPEFTDQFADKTIPLTLGEDIDGIAGATVTSKAVVDGINAAAEKLMRYLPQQAPKQNGKTINASTIGYGGPVLTRVTFDEQGVITGIEIGGVRFQETDGLGSRIREMDFASQFIGKKPPLVLGQDIDSVSGATVSSQAAVDAVNDAQEFLNKP